MRPPLWNKTRMQKLIWGLALAGVFGTMAWATWPEPARMQSGQAQESDTVRLLGVMRDRQLGEVSGLAHASNGTGLLWMHNDSGDQPRLFLVQSSGKSLQEVALAGAEHRDWEDLCRLSWQDKPHLLVGDVGDNSARRETCQLYLFPEPASPPTEENRPLEQISATPRRIEFRYADGPRNCEALGFDSESKLLLMIEKLAGNAPAATQAGVYGLDLQPLEESSTVPKSSPLVAQRIGEVPWRNVTALDIAAEGRRMFVRTYFEGYLLERKPEESWSTRLAREFPEAIRLPAEAQGEAACFTPDGRAVVLTSEFPFQPIWRLELPAADVESDAAPQLASSPPLPEGRNQEAEHEIKKLILPGEAFRCADRAAFILWPKPELRREPQPWIFYAPTLPPYPDEAEKWMHQQFLDAGIAVAGIDVGEAYGNPAAREVFEKFYGELTNQRGLAKRPCLLGRSRGGLWVSSWAADHPERFAGLAGIYPVFDWKTYPGIEPAAAAYGLTADQLSARAGELNPIARADRLAKARLPVFLIHGDVDTVVPLAENSAALAEVYRQTGAGDVLQLVVAQGQGHNMWEGFFRCRELVDFAIARARAGAASERATEPKDKPQR